MPELRGRGAIAVDALDDVALDAAALGLAEVGLHPDRGIDEVGVLAVAGSGALDDDQGGPLRNLDAPGTTALLPGGWPIAHCLAAVQRQQDLLQEQVTPAEVRLVPGDVVGVHDASLAMGCGEVAGQGGLAGGSSTVDRKNEGPLPHRPQKPLEQVHEGHRPPGPCLRLTLG
ncbi:MAG: hypothetical protein Q4G67_14795 [Actinomycetia bacterium]|nr:hypothetical protein [Actinomycetes bacterium]